MSKCSFAVVYCHFIIPDTNELQVRLFGPHPACLDGADDGELADETSRLSDPIRLVRMVNQIHWQSPPGIFFTIRTRRMGSDEMNVCRS